MTAPAKNTAGDVSPSRTIITDDPLSHLAEWHQAGEAVALVTLVGVEGAAPRPLGAQMAVTSSGKAAGYLSGGCLEQAVILEAQSAIAEGKNRLLRYGKGSPFIDIKLPCESGLDIYIDQAISADCILEMSAHSKARRPFVLKTDLQQGTSTVLPSVAGATQRTENQFIRAYQPATRLILLGSGPTAERLLALADASGLEVQIFSPDESLREKADHFSHFTTPTHLPQIPVDGWTAAVLTFHEHEWEIPLLQSLLKTDCFYIGAIGNQKVARDRIETLKQLGLSEQQLARLTSPAGTIQGAKDANALAIGILAEVMGTAHNTVSKI